MNTAAIAAISALIGALFGGIGLIIEKLFSKNENRAMQYSHEETIIQLMTTQNSNSQKMIDAIEGLRDDVGSLKTEFQGLNARVLKLEEDKLKS